MVKMLDLHGQSHHYVATETGPVRNAAQAHMLWDNKVLEQWTAAPVSV